MDTGKTGRSLAVEHLLFLSDEDLSPWLEVTAMIFAGETVDCLKYGTLSPLYKDLSRFRSVTLPEGWRYIRYDVSQCIGVSCIAVYRQNDVSEMMYRFFSMCARVSKCIGCIRPDTSRIHDTSDVSDVS